MDDLESGWEIVRDYDRVYEYKEISYILKEKHLRLMCSHYVRHVAVSQRFENEYADMSYVESFSNLLYKFIVMLFPR